MTRSAIMIGIRAMGTSRTHLFPGIDCGLRIILPKTEDQRAKRHAERSVNCLGLRCRIVSQEFNSDIGIAHWNDTGLLHAQDSHVDLSLTETTGRIDDSITLDPSASAAMAGKARQTSVEMPVTMSFLRPVALTASTTRFSSQALTVVRSIIGAPCRTSASSGMSGPHHFSVVVVTTTGILSASTARVRPTTLCLS